MTAPDPITAAEISAAYRKSDLRQIGIGIDRAIKSNAIYIALRATARAMRAKEQQQHGKPAPTRRALI